MKKFISRYVVSQKARPPLTVILRVRLFYAMKDGSVSSDFAFGGSDVQREMLKREGIAFLPDGRADMEKCGLGL